VRSHLSHERFAIEEIVADKAYLSRANLDASNLGSDPVRPVQVEQQGRGPGCVALHVGHAPEPMAG
jgi:hypothetical protein